VERRAVVHDGQGIEVPLVGPLGEFGAAMKIGDALAERAPGLATAGVVLEGAG
jgi:hypothetical protein